MTHCMRKHSVAVLPDHGEGHVLLGEFAFSCSEIISYFFFIFFI